VRKAAPRTVAFFSLRFLAQRRRWCFRPLFYQKHKVKDAGNYMESQSILGKGLKGIRDKIYLVTKIETTDPTRARGAVEKSLEQLQTDYLDAILSWTRVLALFAVVAILSGAWMSHAAMAQEEKAVEGHPSVLGRDITLWSDGTRLSGLLLYPKDRKDSRDQRRADGVSRAQREKALRRLQRTNPGRCNEARDPLVRQVPERREVGQPVPFFNRLLPPLHGVAWPVNTNFQSTVLVADGVIRTAAVWGGFFVSTFSPSTSALVKR